MLVLIQLGGIGFMTATSMVYMLIGRRITLKDRIVIKDSLNETNLQGVVRMTRNVLIVTAVAEAAGILLLSIRFVPEYGVLRGLYYLSLIHIYFITLHIPQNEKTKGFLSTPEFSKMKDGVIVLNFARGGLVKTTSLFDAMESGKVKDVYKRQPEDALKTVDRAVTICTRGNPLVQRAREACTQENRPYNVFIIQR